MPSTNPRGGNHWKEIAPRIRKLSACTSNLSASPVRIQVCVGKTIDFFPFLFLFPMAARAGGNSFLQLVAGVYRRSSCILYREKTSHFETSNVGRHRGERSSAFVHGCGRKSQMTKRRDVTRATRPADHELALSPKGSSP